MKMLRYLVAAGCGGLVLCLVGCGPGPKDQQIQALQEEVNRLQAENADLRSRLARAISERDEARLRASDLEQQLRALQGRMAEGAKKRGEWEELPGIAWTDIADDILFDSGKADLKPAGRERLQRVFAEIRERYPNRQVWIVGHTDTDPIKYSKWRDNLELSVQRACTVHRELQKLGLDPVKMVAAGQGEYNPKASNATAVGKQQNRRVQIVAVEIPEAARRGTAPAERG